MEKKLRQKITYKYRKNRRNNKSNKNQDLVKKQKTIRTPKCPQISKDHLSLTVPIKCIEY